MFSGIWLPIVTPLRNGEVDIDALQRLADYYLRTEIAGIVALSTTGEAALLQEAEPLTVLQALSEVVRSRLPMLIGVGGSNTRNVLHEIQRYERWDCAGYLVSAPSCVCPDQAGVQWHFEQAAGATERPIVLYDVPRPIRPPSKQCSHSIIRSATKHACRSHVHRRNSSSVWAPHATGYRICAPSLPAW